MDDPYDELTPTQELIMEVLAGRYRTGETTWWTFSSKPAIRRAANVLASKGLAHVMSSQTEGTFRIGLTDDGVRACLSPNYTTPNDRVVRAVGQSTCPNVGMMCNCTGACLRGHLGAFSGTLHFRSDPVL